MTLPEINNAALLPPYRTDAETALIPADPDGILFSPDWVEELILMEVHPETATAEGTLTSLIRILDHAAAIGVNGIWLTPIYRKGPLGNGYGNNKMKAKLIDENIIAVANENAKTVVAELLSATVQAVDPEFTVVVVQ